MNGGKSKLAAKAAAKVVSESSSDDSSDDSEDEKVAVVKPATVATKLKAAVPTTSGKAAKSSASSSDDDSSSEEEDAVTTKEIVPAKTVPEDDESSSDSDDEEETAITKGKLTVPAVAPITAKEESSSSDESDDEEEVVAKKAVAPVTKGKGATVSAKPNAEPASSSDSSGTQQTYNSPSYQEYIINRVYRKEYPFSSMRLNSFWHVKRLLLIQIQTLPSSMQHKWIEIIDIVCNTTTQSLAIWDYAMGCSDIIEHK